MPAPEQTKTAAFTAELHDLLKKYDATLFVGRHGLVVEIGDDLHTLSPNRSYLSACDLENPNE